MKQFIRIFVLMNIALSFSAIMSTAVLAASFSVTPTSLELSGGVKSGAFSVTNSGSDKFTCKIDVKEWTQDPDGKDVYSEAKDVVFFPKIMNVEPNEQRAVRVGIKVPAGLKEKTYRLFAEEIPSQKKETEAKTEGKITAGLTIAFRYSVPIFVKPVQQQEAAVIDKVDMSKGVVRAVVRNTGNIRVKLLSVTFKGKAIDGKELFSQDVSGWYILHGTARGYETTVPKDVCSELATIEVNAHAENLAINGTLNVQRKMCVL